MPVISAVIIKKPRVRRRCENCPRIIEIGEPTLRMYGMARFGDRPYTIYLHPVCAHTTDKKVVEARRKAGA